jgi:hypothetical protein
VNEHELPNLGPLIFTVLFVAAAVWRRVRRSGGSPPRTRSRSPIVPVPRTSAPAAAPAAARPARRRLAEPAVPAAPPPRPRPTFAPAMGDMLSNEAAAAFPVLDLSLGDEPDGMPAAPRPRSRRTGARIGSRGWGVNAIVAAEVLGTPVGLRPGATVGVPHAF